MGSIVKHGRGLVIPGWPALQIGQGRVAAPGAPPAWSPADLAGLIVWHEAALGVTESGGAVSQWDDQSGQGNHVVQATGGNKPVYSATGFNTSFPGVTFDKDGPSFLTKTSFPLNSATLSLFILFAQTNDSQINCGLLSVKTTSSGVDYSGAGFVVTAQSGVEALLHNDGNQGNGGALLSTTTNTPVLLGWVKAGGQVNAYKNGSVQGAATANSATWGDAAAANVLAYGTRPWNGNTPSFDGTMAMCLMGTGDWSSDIADIVTYCNDNYGTAF